MSLKPCNAVEGASLSKEAIDSNFSDLHDPLSALQAKGEADRCLYCYDAPCIQACPTSIDIPTFIHQIRTGNIEGSAKTILSANIMGGTCARACPTEVLCEQACVLNASEEQPVEIGALQRTAVDYLMAAHGPHPFKRAAETGKHLAVVGAGPAGLSCAHRAAMLGHNVTIYEAKAKPGGLNEYGLAAYKMVDDFAQKEVAFLLGIGGIEIKYHQRLGETVSLDELRDTFDVVYIGVGLGSTNALQLEGEDKDGILDAVDFIEDLRQASEKSSIFVGDNVIVIGAGNTAIDAAVQAKRLGANTVTLVYRRGEENMSATDWEVNLARTNGVNIRLWSAPTAIKGNGRVEAMSFESMTVSDGKLTGSGKSFDLPADMVLKAIGQKLDVSVLDGFEMAGGKITVGDNFETSIAGVFAGGDCIKSGDDLTVQAVEDGKQAAHAIDAYLAAK
ncbi:MAG: NAD(P)-dependent oxidoreductase [Kordiimonadaceae bacterium]|nr:NAD(P)-dependent oxidoreductase [Kordiimonadaceae bacterium]